MADGPTRILRIAILQGERVIEERLVRRRGPVTLGQSAKNLFMLPTADVPRTLTLFDVVSGGYMLRVTDDMKGRVWLGEGNVIKLDRRAELALTPHARGKVTFGDITVLFQFVDAPPVQPRPQLPSSVRSSLLHDMDWLLVSVLCASLLTHLSFVLFMMRFEPQHRPEIEEIPDRFVKFLVPQMPKPTPHEEPKPKESAVVSHERKPTPRVVTATTEAKIPTPSSARHHAELMAQVQNMGLLAQLTAKGDGHGGAVADLLRDSFVSADADQVFAHVGGVEIAKAGGAETKGANVTGQLRANAALHGDSVRELKLADKTEEHAVHGTVRDSAPTQVDGPLDPGIIAGEIRRRLGAVRACYEAALKRNPSLSGKLVLRFAVSMIGKVTSLEIDTDTLNDPEVIACIKARAFSWRFPPSAEPIEFSYPFVFQAAK
jgi:hypothetical protein